jgi:exopolysaccharide production protein ExoZ
MINNIQGLRALAALMVVFVHLGVLLATLGLPLFGASGVDLFFVISGFVMVHTTKPRPPPAWDFARNRVARIVPIYWLMTLSVFVVALLAPQLLGATRADGAQLLKSLLFIPFKKVNGLVEPVLFVGWTLNYEMFFYALFSIGLLFQRYLLGLGAVVAVLIGLCVAGAVFQPTGVLAAFYTNPIILEFGFGMLVALAVERAPATVPLPARMCALVALLAAPLVFFGPLAWPDAPRVLACGVPSAVVVAAAVLLERWGLRLTSPAVLAVGDASYILYLSHPYVTQSVQKLALHLNPTGALSVALIVVSFALVIAVAIVLHLTVEKPLSRAARRLLFAKRLPPQPA